MSGCGAELLGPFRRLVDAEEALRVVNKADAVAWEVASAEYVSAFEAWMVALDGAWPKEGG